MYSHHSVDVTFTRRTLLMTTEMQICGDGDSGSSKLIKFSYHGLHLSRTFGPHAVTPPLTVLQHSTLDMRHLQ